VGYVTLELRPGTADDAEQLGRICYEAFHAIATAHNFPPDFPDPEFATFVISTVLANPGVYSVVAELDGEIVGSNFLDERSLITGVGPITVDPRVQDGRIGRALMLDVMRRSDDAGAPGIRLVQSGYHNRSFSLYMKLGFDAREQLAGVQGPVVDVQVEGHAVRPATAADLDACDTVCRRVHGHDRRGELAEAIDRGMALVVEHDGRITAYTSGLGFTGHCAAESNDGLKALVGSNREILGPGMLVPTRNGELLRWLFDQGFRVVQLMTLMARGLYAEPAGAFLPSILY
jgi:predicted N-acetyltransferase YhbS